MTPPDIFEMIREPFAREFSLPAYETQPERPVDAPERQEVSLDLAMKRLRTSLTAGNKSEYFDEFAIHLFDEITDAEADQVVIALLEGESTIVYEIMLKAKERAIRVTAEQYIDSLGCVV